MNKLNICTAFTQDKYYTESEQKLQETILQIPGLELHSAPVYLKNPAQWGMRHFAFVQMVGCLVSVLETSPNPCMILGCDDKITCCPDLPAGFDVGIFRNPEIDRYATHLDFAAQWICWPTQAGKRFANAVLEIMLFHTANDHRAMHAARALFYGSYKEVDLTQQMAGLIDYKPARIRKREMKNEQ